MASYRIASPLVAFALVFAQAAGAAPVVVRFSHVMADDSPKGHAALKFKERAEKKLASRVEVQVFPNSSLFAAGKEIEALLAGEVQIIAPPLGTLERDAKRLRLFDLPFLFRDGAALERFERTKEGRALLDAIGPRGIKGLAYWHEGMKQISSARDALLRPEDLKGLRFRIASSAVLEAQFRAVGANPLKIPAGEVYKALQTGVVDGQESTWSNIYSQKFYEVQKTIAETNHGVIDYMVLTNARWWNGLPPDVRKGLREAMEEATRYGNGIANDFNERDKRRIAEAGKARIQTLSKADLAAWQKAMEPVWKKFEPDIGKDLIAAARKANR